jgi:hypothetical protein
VQAPVKYELIINLKTAKAIRLAIHSAVLVVRVRRRIAVGV